MRSQHTGDVGRSSDSSDTASHSQSATRPQCEIIRSESASGANSNKQGHLVSLMEFDGEVECLVVGSILYIHRSRNVLPTTSDLLQRGVAHGQIHALSSEKLLARYEGRSSGGAMIVKGAPGAPRASIVAASNAAAITSSPHQRRRRAIVTG